jgi:hypothetical protein
MDVQLFIHLPTEGNLSCITSVDHAQNYSKHLQKGFGMALHFE